MWRRASALIVAITLILPEFFAVPTPCRADPAQRKLIQFGWGEPDTRYLRDHIREMEQTPFDGVVFRVLDTLPDGTQPADDKSFARNIWGKRAYTAQELAPALQDLKTLKVRRFTDNFASLTVTPGDVDWFDDFSPVIGNVRLLTSLARQGGAKGVLFDVEEYGFRLFSYPKQMHADKYSWEQYSAKVKQRGAEVMRAMQEEFPDITVFLSYGLSLPAKQSSPQKLASYDYGLLVPFLNGMIEAANSNVHIVDGYEFSYRYKRAAEFRVAKQVILSEAQRFSDNPAAFKRTVSAAFGLWLDADWRDTGWSVTEMAKNFFSPQQFSDSVYAALMNTDRYVWIYTEQPLWWQSDQPERIVPAEYIGALRAARQQFDGLHE